MKKTLGIFILGVIFISMSASIVSAAGIVEGMQGIISGAYDVFEPVLEVVLGQSSYGNIFVAKLLFLIIIFAIVWKSLEQIPFFSDSSWVLWVVSIAVSIVSVRWIGDSEVVTAILLPYSAFGIAITAGLPFILYFFVVKDFNQTMRRVSWIFFMVIFIGLWAMRSGDSAVAPRVGNFAYIYLVTAGLALSMLIFDKTIHKIKQKIDAEKGMSYKDLERKHRIMDDLNDARDTLTKIVARGGSSTDIKKAKDHIKDLEDELAKLP